MVFDVILLYQVWSDIDKTNHKILELLKKIDSHPDAYFGSEDFQKQVENFNKELMEVRAFINKISHTLDQITGEMREDDLEFQPTVGNRRIIPDRRKIHNRRRHNGLADR
jgi:uncharacterized coiled-coil protein SlyX